MGGRRPPPPICNEGPAFEEGFEGDFARHFLWRVGEDIVILLIITIVIVIAVVIVIVIVRKQSVKAEQPRSREAQKQKDSKGKGKQPTRKKQQAIKAGKSCKQKPKNEKIEQTIREAEKQKREKQEKPKSRGKQKHKNQKQQTQILKQIGPTSKKTETTDGCVGRARVSVRENERASEYGCLADRLG